MVHVEIGLMSKARDIPIAQSRDLILPCIIDGRQEIGGVAVLYALEQRAKQRGLTAFLHVIDKFAVKLINLVPVRNIPLYPFGWGGHG